MRSPSFANDAAPGKPTNVRQERKRQSQRSYFELYKFSTTWQRVVIIFGVLSAILGSLGIPFLIVLYGEFTTLLVDRVREEGRTTDTILIRLFGGGRIL